MIGFFEFRFDRQCNCKDRAALRTMLNFDFAIVIIDNLGADNQANAMAAGFCGETGGESFLQ